MKRVAYPARITFRVQCVWMVGSLRSTGQQGLFELLCRSNIVLDLVVKKI